MNNPDMLTPPYLLSEATVSQLIKELLLRVETPQREVIEGYELLTLREGLHDTPKRVSKAFDHWFGGYNVNIAEVLSTQFEDGGEGYDEMVLVKDIPFYSKC